jgi:hypothetical protein
VRADPSEIATFTLCSRHSSQVRRRGAGRFHLASTIARNDGDICRLAHELFIRPHKDEKTRTGSKEFRKRQRGFGYQLRPLAKNAILYLRKGNSQADSTEALLLLNRDFRQAWNPGRYILKNYLLFAEGIVFADGSILVLKSALKILLKPIVPT